MEDDNRKLLRIILNMAWPAILESVFFSLTALIDSYMVSVLGENAVAGVGITAQPTGRKIGRTPIELSLPEYFLLLWLLYL